MQLTVGGCPAACTPFSSGGASDRHHASSLRMMSAGDFSSCANARSAARSWPMIAAARAPLPSTSPMTMARPPAVRVERRGSLVRAAHVGPDELRNRLREKIILEREGGLPLGLEEHRVVDR